MLVARNPCPGVNLPSLTVVVGQSEVRALVHLFGTGPDVFVVHLQTCNATLLPAKTLEKMLKQVPPLIPYLNAVAVS